MKFILSIDTEGDNQWDHGREITTENIKFVPRFQEFCNKFSVRPTYLITSEICDDPFAREIFGQYSKDGEAEIGAHLHSWTTPPFSDKKGLRYNDSDHAYASELPAGLLREKIKYLTGQIGEATGKRPYSFRSGRYGFNETVAEALCENSYLVDSSVTPFTSWSGNKGMSDESGGPDFSDKKPFPYFIRSGKGELLEIPVTILPTRFPLNINPELAEKYFRNADRFLMLKVLRKFFYKDQPVWLRPFVWTKISVFEDLVNEAIKLKLPYLVMMFHSSELMPGCSDYRKDEKSIEDLYILLEAFFRLLVNKGIVSGTLAEVAAESNQK